MRTLRAFFTCCWLTIATLGFTGCATTEHLDTADKVQEKPQDDLTTAQKIGSYLWWPFQYGLLWGGTALANH